MSASALPALPADPFLDEIERMHAFRDMLESVTDADRAALAASDPGLAKDWIIRARREQLPPREPGWHTWVLLAGRAFGKTIAITSTANIAVRSGVKLIHAIAQTAADCRDVLIEGPSGLIATAPPDLKPRWVETKRRLEYPNGARILMFSADQPDSLRGPECELCLIDELAAMNYQQAVFDNAKLGLRVGPFPRMIIATTPRPTKLVRSFGKMPGVVTTGSTFSNTANLPTSYVEQMMEYKEGSRFSLQDIHGLIVEDGDSEIFHEAWILRDPVPEEMIEQAAIGVDPSGGADETGMIAAARLIDGRYAILADRTCRGSPAHWGEEVVRAYDQFDATDVVMEVNYGGANVEDVVKQAAIRVHEQGQREEAHIRIKAVTASRGKIVRADPTSLLYERGKVLHRPGLPLLESEMINFRRNWNRERDGSPNRVDAMVWALTRLKALVMDVPIA